MLEASELPVGISKMTELDWLSRAVVTLAEREEPLEMSMARGDDDPDLSESLKDIADHLGKHGSKGIVVVTGGLGAPAAPALSFRFPRGGTVHYMARPSGPEREPFLDLLSRRAPEAGREPESRIAALGQMEEPARILVFVTSACPFCPGAVRAATDLAADSDKVTASVIDAERFPDLARNYTVLSVPLTIIDDGLRLTEVVSKEKLASRLLERGTIHYEGSVFRSFLAAGDVEGASRRLVDRPDNASAFADAWRESTLSSRMGLMLVSETALEMEPRVLDEALAPLIELLDSEDESLKGDSADLLGQIGHADAIGPLEKLLEDPNPDVVEIAEEALDRIRGE